MEESVLEKISNSQNLKELEQLIESEKSTFGFDFEKEYEENRQEIENFVNKGSYSSVVKKKEHYEELIRRMQQQNENMQRTVQNGQGKIERIMTIRNDGEY